MAADAVLAGASSVGRNAFFTIHQPELVALRLELGFPRHPTQMVMSNAGHLDLSSRLFSMPDVPVIVLAGPECERTIAPQVRDRSWVTVVPIGDSLRDAFAVLRRDHHIGRISAIGGRVDGDQSRRCGSRAGSVSHDIRRSMRGSRTRRGMWGRGFRGWKRSQKKER